MKKKASNVKRTPAVAVKRVVRVRRMEENYFYAIRIQKGRWPAFLARHNASAPNLFWFHEDAVKYLNKCKKSKPSCDCHKCDPEKLDIVKVFVRWSATGKRYNTPGDMFRSAEELKRKHSNVVREPSRTHDTQQPET